MWMYKFWLSGIYSSGADEATANALAEKVSAENEGRVSILHDAEMAAKDPDNTLPTLFGDKEFVREWLQLKPLLGDMDMRPILHPQ